MESLINMLAHLSSNHERVDAAIVAFRMKPEEGDIGNPEVQILTLGDDAVTIFGMGELVKMQLFDQLGGDK